MGVVFPHARKLCARPRLINDGRGIANGEVTRVKGMELKIPVEFTVGVDGYFGFPCEMKWLAPTARPEDRGHQSKNQEDSGDQPLNHWTLYQGRTWVTATAGPECVRC